MAVAGVYSLCGILCWLREVCFFLSLFWTTRLCWDTRQHVHVQFVSKNVIFLWLMKISWWNKQQGENISTSIGHIVNWDYTITINLISFCQETDDSKLNSRIIVKALQADLSTVQYLDFVCGISLIYFSHWIYQWCKHSNIHKWSDGCDRLHIHNHTCLKPCSGSSASISFLMQHN